MKLNIHNTFTKELPADAVLENTRRQVFDACFSFVKPTVPKNPVLIHALKEVASLLGINEEDILSEDFLSVFSGQKIYENTQPFAMCYGGHQFGNWAGQLGDGRAINLFELDYNNRHFALQLKGSGATPYSRTADGLAVLRSSIREHLCSEAMFYLGVSTTRSLSLILSGDDVVRDILYDGHPAYEKSAIVCRVSETFIRFGNFEILASRQDTKNLKLLADYTINHFYPEIKSIENERYVELVKCVAERTLKMIIDWQRVGFVHGVMNTDNMSIIGNTIDYGPYGWLENYDPTWTPNTTDIQHKRYQFGQQGNIALWNLYKLANAIYPLVEDAKAFEEILQAFPKLYNVAYQIMMMQKLGLENKQENDFQLIEELESILQLVETDMTIFFRNLANFSTNFSVDENFKCIQSAFYLDDYLNGNIYTQWKIWIEKYVNRLRLETKKEEDKKASMNVINPKYVLRNYMAQLAIDAANEGKYNLINELYELLQKPYEEQPENEIWFAKRPDWARHKVGCSMLSCSS
jgi:uncharacterized protein YdiU (UPF0061 family)